MSDKNIILETLEGFPKVDLEDIRHYFGADVPSGARKKEFVARLGAYIIEKPSLWLGKMLERDLRLLKRLVDAGPGVPLYLDYPDFPSVLETVNLLGSDTSDEDFRAVWIPKELYDVVAPQIDSALAQGDESGRFEMERAALGYLNLYGVVTARFFMDCMMEYCDWDGRMRQDVFFSELVESPVLKLCRLDSGGHRYLAAPSIFDMKAILKSRKEYDAIREWRRFTPEQALEAGTGSPYFVYGLGSEEGRRLVGMLTRLGYSGDDLVREEHEIWMNSQMTGGDSSTEDIFASVTKKQDDIDAFDDYNACMEIVASYANSLPKWLLKGHSSNEANCLKVVLQTEEEPLDAIIKRNPLLGLFVPPAAPDAPCPCGSGISYRLCHGRRLN